MAAASRSSRSKLFAIPSGDTPAHHTATCSPPLAFRASYHWHEDLADACNTQPVKYTCVIAIGATRVHTQWRGEEGRETLNITVFYHILLSLSQSTFFFAHIL